MHKKCIIKRCCGNIIILKIIPKEKAKEEDKIYYGNIII